MGIRRRRAYNTRHTYATVVLMAGVNLAYIARQLGHKDTSMLLKHYARWIDGADKGSEAAKLNLAFGPAVSGTKEPDQFRLGELAQENIKSYKIKDLMAGATGLEPATYGVTGRHSNQLSYAPAGVSRGGPRKDGRCRAPALLSQAGR